MIRLRYQSMFAEEPAHAYLDTLAQRLRTVSGAGTALEVIGTPSGGRQPYNPLSPAEVVERAEAAAADGCDAFLIGNIADTGCEEARASVDIPVLGLGEVSAQAAYASGNRFGSISTDPELALSFENVVDRVGARDRFAGTYLLPKAARATPDDLLAAFEHAGRQSSFLDTWATTARAAVADGADVLIPTGGLAMEMLRNAGITQLGGALVLDGPAILIRKGRLAAFPCRP